MEIIIFAYRYFCTYRFVLAPDIKELIKNSSKKDEYNTE